jgi:hypothetical protein
MGAERVAKADMPIGRWHNLVNRELQSWAWNAPPKQARKSHGGVGPMKNAPHLALLAAFAFGCGKANSEALTPDGSLEASETIEDSSDRGTASAAGDDSWNGATAPEGGDGSFDVRGDSGNAPREAGPLITTPLAHRAASADCPEPRPPGGGSHCQSSIGGAPGCTVDQNCDSGLNGRCSCLFTSGGVDASYVACTYDGCTSDQGCNGGVCVCDPNGNYCVGGNCRTDSDCGDGGYCSPTGNWNSGECNIGPAGFFCHTSNDECASDQDCQPEAGTVGYPMCIYSSSENRWACISCQPTG